MANFIGMVFATLKDNGIDTSGMSTDEAVKKYNEIKDKSDRKELTPNENKRLKELGINEEKTPNNKEIKFDNAFEKTERLKKVKQTIIDLSNKYKNDLHSVKKASVFDKGVSGTHSYGLMELSNTSNHTIVHEFAHSIASKVNINEHNNKTEKFWEELDLLHRDYKKAVKQDIENSISSYADSAGNRNVDEFMAEAFSVAYRDKNGLTDVSDYTKNDKNLFWAYKVLNLIDKYFAK